VNREVVEHRRDPEQVYVSRFQRPRLLLFEEPPHASSTPAIATSSENSLLSDTVVGDGGVVGRGDRGVVNEETN
jgi:hypothetical protein